MSLALTPARPAAACIRRCGRGAAAPAGCRARRRRSSNRGWWPRCARHLAAADRPQPYVLQRRASAARAARDPRAERAVRDHRRSAFALALRRNWRALRRRTARTERGLQPRQRPSPSSTVLRREIPLPVVISHLTHVHGSHLAPPAHCGQFRCDWKLSARRQSADHKSSRTAVIRNRACLAEAGGESWSDS